SRNRGTDAEHLVAQHMAAKGWKIQPVRAGQAGRHGLAIRRGAQRYAVEIKSLAEGRADRVIPLLSQAILQARSHAAQGGNTQPLAVVYVDHAAPSLLAHVQTFAKQYVPDFAVGVISGNGLSYFQGMGLDEHQATPRARARARRGTSAPVQAGNLFSDLNQWMLKILLAPDLPLGLLNAPRDRYHSGADLAAAAQVSTMSASRFLQQLRKDGFLDTSSEHLALVRREELFRRWRAAAMRRPLEMPMRFLIRAAVPAQIRELLNAHPGEACLGLFAAADALQLGHVSGVPPHVYVPRLPRPGRAKGGWDMLMAAPDGPPDLIVRQALSPQSMFRGAVHRDGLVLADVIQVWLDVSDHPSRGAEQADHIYQKILLPLVGDGH
ncbi:MAG: hypothetical protein JWP29_3442, partial [Rhodoferax sp.]|nr:hypothetical protein [Rhodoferax sp.]